MLIVGLDHCSEAPGDAGRDSLQRGDHPPMAAAFDEAQDLVVVATIQDARSSSAATASRA